MSLHLLPCFLACLFCCLAAHCGTLGLQIGTANTIRWGVFKRPVVPPPQKNGKPQTFEQYRKATEPRRQQLRCGHMADACLPLGCLVAKTIALKHSCCREEFADKLEVISYEERDRRGKAGLVIAVRARAAAAVAAVIGPSLLTRPCVQAVTAVAAAFLVFNNASWTTRLWLYPGQRSAQQACSLRHCTGMT